MPDPDSEAVDYSSTEKHASFARSVWESWRLGVWAVGLSVLSTFTQFEYILNTEGGGPLLVGVLGMWIFRFPFLVLVVIRLKITPEPEWGADAFFTGLGVRSSAIQCLAVLGLLWQAFWFFGFLSAGVWVGMITSVLWMIWIYGMTVREQALCYKLYNNRLLDTDR